MATIRSVEISKCLPQLSLTVVAVVVEYEFEAFVTQTEWEQRLAVTTRERSAM
jgi:hypothetical protein